MSTLNRPLAIRMHPDDNVAIIANDGGLPAGTVMPDGPAAGLTLREKVPQGHKVALKDIAAGQAVLRYNVPVGHAREAIAAGSWVHERLLDIPPARELQGVVGQVATAIVRSSLVIRNVVGRASAPPPWLRWVPPASLARRESSGSPSRPKRSPRPTVRP